MFHVPLGPSVWCGSDKLSRASSRFAAERAALMYSAAHVEPKTAAASGADMSSSAPVANGNGPTTGSESGTRAGAVVPRSRRRHQLHRAQSLRGAVRA